MAEKSIYNLHGIEVTITKKRMKNLILKVRPQEGDVVVSAPLAMDLKEIHGFIDSRYQWICAQKEKIASLARQAPQYQDGELMPFWGSYYPIRRMASRSYQLQWKDDHFLLKVPERCPLDVCEQLFEMFYRDVLNKKILYYIKKWREPMNVSVEEFRIRKMKTRWGTCNVRDKRIWISLELVKRPLDCLEYVVVHELAHLLERNHSPRFWSIVGLFLPSYREQEERLRQPQIPPQI